MSLELHIMLIMVQGHSACDVCRLTLLEVSAGTWTMIRSAPYSRAPVNLPFGAVIVSVKLHSAAPCPDTLPIEHLLLIPFC